MATCRIKLNFKGQALIMQSIVLKEEKRLISLQRLNTKKIQRLSKENRLIRQNTNLYKFKPIPGCQVSLIKKIRPNSKVNPTTKQYSLIYLGLCPF